jgi:hypothetical protein
MLREAVDYYHSLLTDQVSADADGLMRSILRAGGLYFGDRPICRVLRPHFYTEEQWDFLKKHSRLILNAFARAHTACLEDASLREQLCLEDYEEKLFNLDAHMAAPWTSSRLDAFFDVESATLRYVEYNAETPAGLGYGDQLTDVFLKLEPMKRFQERYVIQPSQGMDSLFDVLIRAYREWGGQQMPQIGIVDWHEVPTLNEHEICRRHFERRGARTVLADPRALEYHDGHLWAGDFRIDLVYKRVLVSELIRRMGVDNTIVRAVRDHAALMSNGFSCKLMAKKASLAFMSDERNAHVFSPAERAAIEMHIPWTRRVEERKTLYGGDEVDLLPFIAEHRGRLVIKPNDEYGGKGVVIGWESSSEQWNVAIQDAMTTPYVVQERVDMVQRNFPMLMDNGSLDISPRFVDADPYIFYGEDVGGCLTRLSEVSLLNVTAGGGSVVPMFVIRKKE